MESQGTNSVHSTNLTPGQKLHFENNRVIVRVWTSQWHGGETVGHVSTEILKTDLPGTYTNNTYISFWPYYKQGDYPGVNYVSRCLVEPNPENNVESESEGWSCMETYVDDLKMEDRPPEFMICFYTLDICKIQHVFSVFKNSEASNIWKLAGQYQPVKNTSKVMQPELLRRKESCVSLACICLDVGGLNKYLGFKKEIYGSSAETSKSSIENLKFKDFQFIRPLANSSVYSAEEVLFICGFCISPDVMVRRLKQAKVAELKQNENNIKLLGPFVHKSAGSVDVIEWTPSTTEEVDEPKKSKCNIV